VLGLYHVNKLFQVDTDMAEHTCAFSFGCFATKRSKLVRPLTMEPGTHMTDETKISLSYDSIVNQYEIESTIILVLVLFALENPRHKFGKLSKLITCLEAMPQ
jgi:hypothetical protein